MANRQTDFLYSLSPFTNWWKIPHHPKMNQIPHKKTLQGYRFAFSSIKLNTKVAIHCKTHFLKGQHVWNRLDLSQRTYVGFSQWAATCNTKSYNIQASAVIWIFFMVIKFIYYFVCFNSWEILFASLIRIFSRIAKNTIGKI